MSSEKNKSDKSVKKEQTVNVRALSKLEVGNTLYGAGYKDPIPMEVEKAKALESAGKVQIVG